MILKDKLRLTYLDSDWLELEELSDGSLKMQTMMKRDEHVVWRKLERERRGTAHRNER